MSYALSLTAHYREVRRRISAGPKLRLVETTPMPAPVIATERDWLRVASIDPGRVTCKTIVEAVSRATSVPVDDILGMRRARRLVHARQLTAALCRRLTTNSLPEIGRRLGNRDHTTIIHAVNKLDAAGFSSWRVPQGVDLDAIVGSAVAHMRGAQ